MNFLIILEITVIALNLILSVVSTEKRRLSGLKYLLNIAFILTVVIGSRYYLYSVGAEGLKRLLKAEILVSSMYFYATDFVTGIKSGNDSEVMRKTLFKALANHIIHIVLFLLVVIFL